MVFVLVSRNNFIWRTIALFLSLLLFSSMADANSELICRKPKYLNCTMTHRVQTSLWCDYTNFTSIPIPENLVGEFDEPPEKSIKITFKHSCLKNIDRNSLMHYSWVVELELSENFIAALNVNTFPKLETLKRLFLSRNLINRIDGNTFKNLINLQNLWLDYNQIDSISDSTFSNLSHLINLTLSSNELRTLPQEAFRKLPRLKMLDLSGNQLAKFLPEYLILLSNLESLNLNENNLKTFDSHIYLAASGLKQLYLSNNSINCFSADAFNKQGLMVIEIANNPLKRPNSKWFSRFIRENSATSVDSSLVMSKSGSWICDCKVYPYHLFLLTLSDEWLQKLDIECSEPSNLRGMVLSQLTWNLLSVHGKCSTPDNNEPKCSTMSNYPSSIATNTALFTIDTAVENLFSEPELEGLNSNEAPINILTPEPVSESKIVIFVLVALAGVSVCVSIIVIICLAVIYRRRFKVKKGVPQSSEFLTTENRSSRTVSVIDMVSNERNDDPSLQYQTTPMSIHRTSSSDAENEVDSNMLNETRPKHVIGETPTSSISNASVHQYDRLNLPPSGSSIQQTLPVQPPQKRTCPTCSSRSPRYTGAHPTSHQTETIKTADRSSGTNSVIDSKERNNDSSLYQTTPLLMHRTSSSNAEEEVDSNMLNETRPKHVIGETPTSSISNVAVHQYERLHFPPSGSSIEQTLPIQHPQQRLCLTCSPESPRCTGDNPTRQTETKLHQISNQHYYHQCPKFTNESQICFNQTI